MITVLAFDKVIKGCGQMKPVQVLLGGTGEHSLMAKVLGSKSLDLGFRFCSCLATAASMSFSCNSQPAPMAPEKAPDIELLIRWSKQ